MADVVVPKPNVKLAAPLNVPAAPHLALPTRRVTAPAVHRYVQDRTGNFRSLPFFALLNGRRIDTSQAAPLSTIFRMPLIARQRITPQPAMARLFAQQAPKSFLQPQMPALFTNEPVAPEIAAKVVARQDSEPTAKPILTRLTGRRELGTPHLATRPARAQTAVTARPAVTTTARPNLFGARPVVVTAQARPVTLTDSQLPQTVHTEKTAVQAPREEFSPQQALAKIKDTFGLKVRAFAANLYDDGVIPMPAMPKMAKALSQSFNEIFQALDKIGSSAPEQLTGDDIQKAVATLQALGLLDELKKVMPGFDALTGQTKASALTQFVMGLFFNPNFALVLKGRLELLMMRQAQTMLAQMNTRPVVRIVGPRHVTPDLRARRAELRADEAPEDEDDDTLVTKPGASAGTDANGGGNQEQQQQQ